MELLHSPVLVADLKLWSCTQAKKGEPLTFGVIIRWAKFHRSQFPPVGISPQMVVKKDRIRIREPTQNALSLDVLGIVAEIVYII